MKDNIHPEWYPEARVVCSCGNTFTVGATVPEITTEVCSSCHPFFTGEQRIVDTAGQVERFMRRLEAGVEQRQTEQLRKQKKKESERAAKRRRRGLAPLRASRSGEAGAESETASASASPDAGGEPAGDAPEPDTTTASGKDDATE